MRTTAVQPANTGSIVPKARSNPGRGQRSVLIAHQSTIPHYRIPFYEALAELKPEWWNFEVVCDNSPARRQRVFLEPVDPATFGFKTAPTHTYSLQISGKKLVFQTFIEKLSQYDLVVVEDAFHNLSYPASRFLCRRGTALAYWGHGRDRSTVHPSLLKKMSERLKLHWSKTCDGYFAYTSGVRDDLSARGVDPGKIFVLNNTIDILSERAVFESLKERRHGLKAEVGLKDRRVLLFVGRFRKDKRIGFLGASVRALRTAFPEYHLVVVGGGDQSEVDRLFQIIGDDGISYHGVIVDRPRLAQWFVIADAYVFPGSVGLGVVHSLCYDLTPVIVDSPAHNPEIEYLNADNAVIAPEGCTPEEYAQTIADFCSNRQRWRRMRGNAWPSIQHLTIRAMAEEFVGGVNQILG